MSDLYVKLKEALNLIDSPSPKIHKTKSGIYSTCIKVSESVLKILGYILSVFIELAIVPFAALLYPFGAMSFNPKKLPPNCKKVTVLVHGFLHNNEAWFYLKPQLQKYPALGPIFTINLGHPFQSIDDYTRKLEAEIEKIRQMTDNGQLEVNLVGHSMGGLVCCNYAADIMDKGPVRLWSKRPVEIRNIVTISSPLQGAGLAKIAKFLPCVKDMIPSGKFMKKFEGKMANFHRPIYPIGCDKDIVVQKNRTHLPGQYNHKEFKYLGHLGCLLSPKLAKYIVECLLKT